MVTHIFPNVHFEPSLFRFPSTQNRHDWNARHCPRINANGKQRRNGYLHIISDFDLTRAGPIRGRFTLFFSPARIVATLGQSDTAVSSSPLGSFLPPDNAKLLIRRRHNSTGCQESPCDSFPEFMMASSPVDNKNDTHRRRVHRVAGSCAIFLLHLYTLHQGSFNRLASRINRRLSPFLINNSRGKSGSVRSESTPSVIADIRRLRTFYMQLDRISTAPGTELQVLTRVKVCHRIFHFSRGTRRRCS